jgi:hypothetical protein
MSRRRTKAERATHLKKMWGSYLVGVNPTEIVRRAVEQFGIAPRTAWDDWAELEAQMEQYGQEHLDPARREKLFGGGLYRLEQILEQAMAAQERSLAHSVIQTWFKLHGLFPAESVTHRHTGTGPGGAIPVLSIEGVRPPPDRPDDNPPPCGLKELGEDATAEGPR